MTLPRKKKRNPWGDRLKKFRLNLGFTQEEMAVKLDLSVGTWRNWEQGRTEPNVFAIRLIEVIFKAKIPR